MSTIPETINRAAETDGSILAAPLLEVVGVSKGYGPAEDRTEVLSDINLTIHEGEFVAIVGYSGAGKTTLMALLAGLIQPDAGTLEFDGHPMNGPGPERGLVFQNYSLLPWLTVFENVKLAVDQVFRDWPEAKRIEHTEHHVALVNLAAARDKRPGELSGGMRQRVSVARTLAMNPRVLLLDEPLSALDALTRATLQDEIARLWAEDRKTVVLITNDPDEAILLADRVIPLTRGPNAHLAASIPVTLPRPRDRRRINEDPEFKRLRNQIVEALLAAGSRPKVTVTRDLDSSRHRAGGHLRPQTRVGSPNANPAHRASSREGGGRMRISEHLFQNIEH